MVSALLFNSPSAFLCTTCYEHRVAAPGSAQRRISRPREVGISSDMKTIKALHRQARRTHVRVTLLLILAMVLTGRESGHQDGLKAQATPGCPAYPNNPVACENLLPGDTGWDIAGAGDFTIQGFATDISVNVGQRVDFKIDTPSDNYTIDIYRLGYYGGARARRGVAIVPSVPPPPPQDPP